MKPKPKIMPVGSNADRESVKTRARLGDGLVEYTIDPERFPPSRVVYYNDKFVVINDMFPKASIHLLILPRDPEKNILRPQEAFDDQKFLEECRLEEAKVREIVAEELRRRFGQYSKAEQSRIQAMDAAEPPEVLPAGRDWAQGVKSGIHANPSMNHLHIHVMSKDMVSEPMKKSHHYLSFTTDFFVGLEQFPLAKDDYRRRYRSFREHGMLCWRCGKDFGHEVKKLKLHLESELEEWKHE
ncbi:putative aprataxin, HIT-like superfamily [Septoria linicola]|nr:putative aprataxin, HIT-like superfamily [Septoria linicola]